jgi:SAM-dependent methyltransferase
MIWIWGAIVLTGLLFAVKMAYVVSTALVLPATQGALFVSTTPRRIRAFLDAVPMTCDQLMVDLGCGNGRVLCSASDRYGVQALGYELNPMAYLQAWTRCFGRKGVTLVRGNFWQADLSAADVVFCYLYPDVLKRLAEKIRSEAKTGATVVSCNFPLPGFAPREVVRPEGGLHHDPIYIYRIPQSTGPDPILGKPVDARPAQGRAAILPRFPGTSSRCRC